MIFFLVVRMENCLLRLVMVFVGLFLKEMLILIKGFFLLFFIIFDSFLFLIFIFDCGIIMIYLFLIL